MSRKPSPPQGGGEASNQPETQRTLSKRQGKLPADAATTEFPDARVATSIGLGAAPRGPSQASRRATRSLRSPPSATAESSSSLGPGPASSARYRSPHSVALGRDVPVQPATTRHLTPTSAEYARATEATPPRELRSRASSFEPSEGRSPNRRRRPRRSKSPLVASSDHPASANPEHSLSSTSSHSLVTPSQSFPFLAQPPPGRTPKRQSRRRSSMPNRMNSASRSPTPSRPTTNPSPIETPVSRRSASASSSRPKRPRADVDVEQSESASTSSQSPSRGTAARRSGSRGPGRRSLPVTRTPSRSFGAKDLRYELIIVQQPTVGCAFGSNDLGRVPCGPPLILRLRVTDGAGREVSIHGEGDGLFCQADLLTETGQVATMLTPVFPHEASPDSPAQSSRSPRRSSRLTSTSSTSTDVQAAAAALNVPGHSVGMLRGTLAASARRLPSPEGPERIYFVFVELSVRARGDSASYFSAAAATRSKRPSWCPKGNDSCVE